MANRATKYDNNIGQTLAKTDSRGKKRCIQD